jgi:hypothetical protein
MPRAPFKIKARFRADSDGARISGTAAFPDGKAQPWQMT